MSRKYPFSTATYHKAHSSFRIHGIPIRTLSGEAGALGRSAAAFLGIHLRNRILPGFFGELWREHPRRKDWFVLFGIAAAQRTRDQHAEGGKITPPRNSHVGSSQKMGWMLSNICTGSDSFGKLDSRPKIWNATRCSCPNSSHADRNRFGTYSIRD